MSRDYKNGLTPQEVEESRRKHGDNVLTPPEKEPIWKQFLEKFSDPIIRILLIALLLSGIINVGLNLLLVLVFRAFPTAATNANVAAKSAAARRGRLRSFT